ncbi:MAG: hypothetical protein JZD41_09655, partial [Thermoproteus sp.]|nr:hypothetical protein [Thermoproteus sp.]
MSWYDPSVGGVGGRMFNLQEAWDHTNRTNPNTAYPYNGKSPWIPGYGGYFLAVPLTDGTNIVQVNIIHRYTDGSILIYNTGQYGGTSVSINVTVNDPPSGLGYNKTTNGTTGTGTTTLAPGQYVLFYKGTTAPAVDATTGLFQTSPFGVNKSQPYELFTNSFLYWNTVPIPKMYLGIKAPGADMEVISNGAAPGVYIMSATTAGTNAYGHPLIGGGVGDGGAQARSYFGSTPYNVSYLIPFFRPFAWVYKDDPNTTTWALGHMVFGSWFGWGEDDAGNVKFIIISQFIISVDSNFNERYRKYVAYIYDVDRGEAYSTYIIKPTVNTYSYGEAGAVNTPVFGGTHDGGDDKATAFAYIDANDNWNKITTPASTTWTYHDNAYGFCNYYSSKINCAEGLGIYSTDTSYTPPAPKSAFGAARMANSIGAEFVRVPSLGDRYLNAGQIYAVVTRLKTFPATTTDTELQNWFMSLQPKALTSTDYSAMLSVLPGSFWLFGQVTDTVSVTAPTTVNVGSQFSVSISCPTRPNTNVWVALVDQNGNIVTSGSG